MNTFNTFKSYMNTGISIPPTPSISVKYYTPSLVRINITPNGNGYSVTGYAYSMNGTSYTTGSTLTSIPSFLDIPISSLSPRSYTLYVKFYNVGIEGYPGSTPMYVSTSYSPSTILSTSFSITNISVSYDSSSNTQVSFTKPTGTISNYYYTTNTSSNLDLIDNYILCSNPNGTTTITCNIYGLTPGTSYQIKIISAFLSSGFKYFSDESGLSSSFIPYTMPSIPIVVGVSGELPYSIRQQYIGVTGYTSNGYPIDYIVPIPTTSVTISNTYINAAYSYQTPNTIIYCIFYISLNTGGKAISNVNGTWYISYSTNRTYTSSFYQQYVSILNSSVDANNNTIYTIQIGFITNLVVPGGGSAGANGGVSGFERVVHFDVNFSLSNDGTNYTNYSSYSYFVQPRLLI